MIYFFFHFWYLNKKIATLDDVPEITVTSHEEAEEAWKELAQQVEANTYKAKMKMMKKKAKKAKVKYLK